MAGPADMECLFDVFVDTMADYKNGHSDMYVSSANLSTYACLELQEKNSLFSMILLKRYYAKSHL